jgi:hypothetical protein
MIAYFNTNEYQSKIWIYNIKLLFFNKQENMSINDEWFSKRTSHCFQDRLD